MLDVKVGRPLEVFIEEEIKIGRHDDASAVVREALLLLQYRRNREDDLNAAVQAGIDDVEAGRVHEYTSREQFMADIMRDE